MDKKKKREHDFAVNAFRVVEEATNIEGKNLHAVALGQLGGRKGGPARASRLTPERRREIAQKAANARWAKERQ